jgi:chemotaxis signal transduction protein
MIEETASWKTIFENTPKRPGESINKYCIRVAESCGRTLSAARFKYYRLYSVNAKRDVEQYKTTTIHTDKAEMGAFNWRDAITPLKDLKNLFDKHKGAQTEAMWTIDTKDPICVIVVGDTHMGSWATDYDQLIAMTEDIITIPNLYVILVGDLLQMSIKLRGVLEVSDNALPPYWQIKFLESWLEEIKHKVIASTWDNHSVMREEAQVGFSTYSEIFKRHTIYHEGIGHVDIGVGKEIYKLAAAHFFRGRTMLNPVHGQMRYMRFEANDREICIAGDSHVYGLIQYTEGGIHRTAINCGSLQNSGYGKRFFSIRHQPEFPCFTLDPNEHSVTVYKSVKQWLIASGQKV